MRAYNVIEGNTLQNLEQRVTNRLDKGWECEGGIYGSSVPTGFCYFQAMTLKPSENPMEDFLRSMQEKAHIRGEKSQPSVLKREEIPNACWTGGT